MPEPLFDIAKRIVVVTGGLGRLGLAFSRALLEQGARVASLDIVSAPERYEKRFGVRPDPDAWLSIEGDVCERSSVERTLALVRARWGTPHALVNNAGLDSPPDAPPEGNGPFETYPERSWDAVMAANTRGPFICTQVIGGAMAEAGRGSVVNVGSIYGMVSPDQRLYAYRQKLGQPFYKPIAYSASKSALLNMTRWLATYWAERGVRVNTLTFGGVFDSQDSEFLEAYEQRVPLGRMATPDDYVGPLVFLVSDASRYMTGANLVVDGGFNAW